MEPNKPTHEITTTEVRQGQTMNVVRWVLIFGLLLVIPGMALVWFLTDR